MISEVDSFDLQRFVDAQEIVFDSVIEELKNGRKVSHWMWFIFPQIKGLGYSEMAQYYAIKNLDEAEKYLEHPVLGKRLVECTSFVMATQNKSITEIFGTPDDAKFFSCMTLFSNVKNSNDLYKQVLDIFFDQKSDTATIDIIRSK